MSSAAARYVVQRAMLLALLQCNALPSIAAGTLLVRESLVIVARFAFYFFLIYFPRCKRCGRRGGDCSGSGGGLVGARVTGKPRVAIAFEVEVSVGVIRALSIVIARVWIAVVHNRV